MEETVPINNKLVSPEWKLAGKELEKEELEQKLAALTGEMNQFTYIVSHDLQAPLRMVTGFLELLERKYASKLDDSAKQYIDYAVKGATKMKSLVFDLLEYSRLSSVVTAHTAVDLNLVLEEVRATLLPVIEETGAIITCGPLPVVLADRKQMLQLFEQLLSNALKFRSDAIPEISIYSKEENGSRLISVADNGIGIDPAFGEKIFIVFRRLHNDDAKYDGTGIGLAICKKIAELHGGTIRVEPGPYQGSHFCLTLPV